MQEPNNYIQTPQGIKEALRRNKRLSLKRVGIHEKQQVKGNTHRDYLEWYIFDKLNTTPQSFIGNLESQYYAEQNFRDRRQRNIDFTRGRHYNEIVYDSEIKSYTTQWNYLRRRNLPPLTYNVTSKLKRSLVGQFREMNTGNIVKCESKDKRGVEIAHMITLCLENIKKKNKSKEKDARNCSEMLLSGSPVFKVMWGSKNNMGKPDARFRIVNRAKFMVNPGIVDYDLDNLHTAVEIHDTSLNDIVGNFADGDWERGMEIRRAYLNYQGDERSQATYSSQSFDGSQLRNVTFQNQGVGNSAYRYYEVWNLISDYEAITTDPLDLGGIPTVHKWRNVDEVKKEIDKINKIRLENSEGDVDEKDLLIKFRADFVNRWFVTFLTQWGLVLDVRESPYKNGMCPFVFNPPDVNGEYHGIIEEVIPAQLSMDRQILQADAIIANASKGVWLVPDTAIPDTHTHKQYLTQLKKADGAVVYKVKDGIENNIPKQVHANATNVGNQVQQLIQLYSGLVDEISGNYGAAQGKPSGSSKTATGYALETQNAGLNVRDIMESYFTVLMDRDELLLNFILEGYTPADFEQITGEPLEKKELEMYGFYVEQSKGTNSPSHRFALEQELLQLVYNQLMPFEVFMEVSHNPLMIQAKQKMEEFKKKQSEQPEATAALQANIEGKQAIAN